MSNKKLIYVLLAILSLSIIGLIYAKLKENKKSSFVEKMSFPDDNPQTNKKISFGKQLFFDKRLSVTETISCSSCHLPHLAFTDGEVKSIGIRGNHSMRNAPTLLNVGFAPTFMADAHIKTLEMQAIVPIQDTNEMGIRMGDLIQKLRRIEDYQQLSLEIFGRDFDAFVLTRSLAAYQRSLISLDSPFDDFYYEHDTTALSDDAKKGWLLFSEKFNCTTCHSLPFFTTFKAENNGLIREYQEDYGRFRVTKDSSDYGKFKIPTLRNVALTSPYMHDGSITSLDTIITLYSQGGYHSVNQSEKITPFEISAHEKQQLIAFLRSLTGKSITQ